MLAATHPPLRRRSALSLHRSCPEWGPPPAAAGTSHSKSSWLRFLCVQPSICMRLQKQAAGIWSGPSGPSGRSPPRNQCRWPTRGRPQQPKERLWRTGAARPAPIRCVRTQLLAGASRVSAMLPLCHYPRPLPSAITLCQFCCPPLEWFSAAAFSSGVIAASAAALSSEGLTAVQTALWDGCRWLPLEMWRCKPMQPLRWAGAPPCFTTECLV